MSRAFRIVPKFTLGLWVMRRTLLLPPPAPTSCVIHRVGSKHSPEVSHRDIRATNCLPHTIKIKRAFSSYHCPLHSICSTQGLKGACWEPCDLVSDQNMSACPSSLQMRQGLRGGQCPLASTSGLQDSAECCWDSVTCTLSSLS